MRTHFRKTLLVCTITFIAQFGCAQPEATPSGRTAYEAVLAYLAGTDRSYVVRAQIAAHDELAAESLSGFVFDLGGGDSHTSGAFGDARVDLLDKYDYLAMFSKGSCQQGWDEFYSRYPDASALLSFSKTGRSELGTRFVVYVVVGIGCLGSRGEVFYLEQERGQWRVVEQRNVWVS